jgi:hypothetical protein
MPSANVIQLHRMLAEKFPGARLRLEERPAPATISTGVAQIDEPCHGGLPKGALTEIVSGEDSSGSATLARQLISSAAAKNQIVTLIDGADSLEVTQIPENILTRLLWVRCRCAADALKAVDLVLRDRNLPLVLLDLKMNPPAQLQKIPATTWYRLQRLVEESGTACAVFTPRPMLSPARMRITLCSRFTLEKLESKTNNLLAELKIEVTGPSRFGETAEPSHKIA